MVDGVVDSGTVPKTTDSSKSDQLPPKDDSNKTASSKAEMAAEVHCDNDDTQLATDEKPQVKKNVIANYFQRSE